jgi:hypothetical protein
VFVTFTWSRSWHSNVGADVAQRNWTPVRGLVGCLHYDTPNESDHLNEITQPWAQALKQLLGVIGVSFIFPRATTLLPPRPPNDVSNPSCATQYDDTGGQRAVEEDGVGCEQLRQKEHVQL